MEEPTPAQRRMVEDLASKRASIAAIAGLTRIPEDIIRRDYQTELLKARRKIFDTAWHKISMDIKVKWGHGVIPRVKMEGIEPEVYFARMAARLRAIGRNEREGQFVDKRLVDFIGEFTPEMLGTLSTSDLTDLAEGALGESIHQEDVKTMQEERARR